MKDIGFSLADIVRILEVYDDREKMEQFFSARQKELEALSQDTAYKLTLLDAARKRLRKEENMSYNVTLKTIPERYAATVHMTIPRYEEEGIIWGKMAEETCRMDLVEDDPCLCAVTYLDGEYKEENVEMMACGTHFMRKETFHLPLFHVFSFLSGSSLLFSVPVPCEKAPRHACLFTCYAKRKKIVLVNNFSIRYKIRAYWPLWHTRPAN